MMATMVVDVGAAQPTTELDYRLQVMLDLLREYFGNKATHAEWVEEIQKRFVGPDRKLRRGWSDDSIDRKITKLETLGLITGGRGRGEFYSAVEKDPERSQTLQPDSKILRQGTAGLPATARNPANTRTLPATENAGDSDKSANGQDHPAASLPVGGWDLLKAAKEQLTGGKPSAA